MADAETSFVLDRCHQLAEQRARSAGKKLKQRKISSRNLLHARLRARIAIARLKDEADAVECDGMVVMNRAMFGGSLHALELLAHINHSSAVHKRLEQAGLDSSTVRDWQSTLSITLTQFREKQQKRQLMVERNEPLAGNKTSSTEKIQSPLLMWQKGQLSTSKTCKFYRSNPTWSGWIDRAQGMFKKYGALVLGQSPVLEEDVCNHIHTHVQKQRSTMCDQSNQSPSTREIHLLKLGQQLADAMVSFTNGKVISSVCAESTSICTKASPHLSIAQLQYEPANVCVEDFCC